MSKCLIFEELDKAVRVEMENASGEYDPLGRYCREWVKTTYHWVGTAAMLPREKGGVVDPRLKAYGLSNLRVVCLSSEMRKAC